jgi:hypothetical protein
MEWDATFGSHRWRVAQCVQRFADGRFFCKGKQRRPDGGGQGHDEAGDLQCGCGEH